MGIIEDGGENIMPTLAEQWIEQGVEKGIQEGIQRTQYYYRCPHMT